MIGKKLKNLREEKGYTLMDLENISGVSYVQITRYENNKSMPTNKTLKKLANSLEVTVEDILENDSKRNIIKDEDLDKKYNRLKGIIAEDDENRYALNKIFDLIIFKGEINEMTAKD